MNLFKPFILGIDDSNFALSAMLLCTIEGNLFHLVNFCSWKFSTSEINYLILGKASYHVDAFENWHHLIEGAQHEIIIMCA